MASDLIERTKRTAYWKSSDGYEDEYDDAPYLLADALTEALARAERAEAECVRLREAMASIRYEAERENGSWIHLKRCIAAQARSAALSELIARDAHLIEGGKC